MKSFSSTIKALEKILNTSNDSMAVIVPLPTAQQYPQLKILATNIQNQGHNYTTFLIIKTKKADNLKVLKI